jgi:hypothetical protein
LDGGSKVQSLSGENKVVKKREERQKFSFPALDNCDSGDWIRDMGKGKFPSCLTDMVEWGVLFVENAMG